MSAYLESRTCQRERHWAVIQLKQRPQLIPWGLRAGIKRLGLCMPAWTSHWMQMSTGCAGVTLGEATPSAEDKSWKVSRSLGPECLGARAGILGVGVHCSTHFRRNRNKKVKIAPDPATPSKGLTFWYVSSQSFKSY